MSPDSAGPPTAEGDDARPTTPDPGLPRVTRLAAYGVIVQATRILLCRIAPGYPDAGALTLPGGGVEFGEAPEAAALREVEEETGLMAAVDGVPVIYSDSGTWERRSGTHAFHTIRFVYPMRITGGAERVEHDGSTDGFEWVPVAEIATPGDRRRFVDLVEKAVTDVRAGRLVLPA